MAEEAKKEEGKKKGGKLPLILALVLVLGGGGFFGMKMRGGEEKKESLKLGARVDLDEFLLNLKDNDTYIRTEISLQLAEGYEAKKVEDSMADVRDAILLILSNKSLSEVRSLEGKSKLKKEIADAVNQVLPPAVEPKEDKKDQEKQPKDQAVKKEVITEIPEDWSSATGPVLKVAFRNFATQ